MATCPNCGEENADRARFCMICATPLVSGPAEPPREERRVVSILFADLVGFTARSDRADPEDVRGTLVPFHRIAKEEIERHGGTLDKFIGDAAMGVFGVPTVHEDDPERAVRAALAIRQRVRDLGAANPGRGFHVRVAVETGEAVVTLATGPRIGENVVGDVVNTASRLQGIAPVDGVVVGEGAHRFVRTALDAHETQPVAVKGKADPLRVWRVAGMRDVASGPGPDTGPFVGRRTDLEALEALWRDVESSGSSRAALVVGEPGIGKSRLLAELKHRLGGPPWFRGSCPPYGEAATFRAFADVVRAHAGIAENDGPDAARAGLEAAVRSLEGDEADRRWLLARLGPLTAPESDAAPGAASQPADRGELFGACERYLRAAAVAGPLVVVLEDLHFAEPAMAALALHLVDALAGALVLLLSTAREELFDRDEDWRDALRRPQGPALLRVGRLSDDEVRELVGGLADEGVPDETGRVLVDRAGGNPLFARELVRMLAETSGEAVADEVPDTVQAVVAARLDVLPPGRRTVVQTASVVGDAFWPGAVAWVAGEEPAAVTSALDSLVERGLVREQQSTLVGEREFSFTHAVIRDVAYGQIPRRQRADRHIAAARWMESALGDRAAVRAEALAHHYEVAVDLTRAAGGEADADVVAAARRFLAVAGDRSASLDAVRATEYYLRALELTPAGDPGRASVLVAAARYGRRSGRVPSELVVRMLEEARAVFLEAGDRRGAGEACLRLSMQLGARGQAERARAALGEGVALLESAPEATPELALAYATLGEDAALGGRFDQALDWSERALALDGTGETRIMALQVRGDARCSLGDLEGVEDIRRSVDMAHRAGLAQDAAVGHSWLAEWRWLLEGPEAGIDEERKAQEVADRRGLTGATMWSRAARLGMLFDLGRWDELLTNGAELLREDVAAGGTQITGLVLAATTPVLVHRGRVDEALERLDEMLDAAREAQDLQFLLPALSTAGMARAAAGEPTAALRLAFEFHGRAHGRPTVYRELYGPAVVRLCLDAGDPDLAGRVAADMAGASPRQQAAALTGRALVAAAAGDHDGALDGFVEAEARWRAAGVVVEEAFAVLGAATSLAGLGRTDDARARAEDAAARFRSLGADSLADRAEELADPRGTPA